MPSLVELKFKRFAHALMARHALSEPNDCSTLPHMCAPQPTDMGQRGRKRAGMVVADARSCISIHARVQRKVS
jgi:hypothetical protein